MIIGKIRKNQMVNSSNTSQRLQWKANWLADTFKLHYVTKQTTAHQICMSTAFNADILSPFTTPTHRL